MVVGIIGLVGSPRKGGNTDTLLQAALQGARKQGAETRLYYLNEMNIRGCQSCFGCKKTGQCLIDDDMQEIYQAIDEADGVIVGTPIYFGRITAQLAAPMDRLFAYLRPNFTSSLGAGKKYAMVIVYRQPDYTTYLPCVYALAQVLENLGFQSGFEPFIGAGLGEAGAAAKNQRYLQAAFNLGKSIATG